MGIRFRTKPTAVALLALSGLGVTQALADGKFIVQPSRQKPAVESVVKELPAPTPERTVNPLARNPVSDSLELALPPIPSGSESSVLADAPQPTIAPSQGGLQWTARGNRAHLHAPANSVAPLELNNRSFTAPTTAPTFAPTTGWAKTTRMPTTDIPTVLEGSTDNRSNRQTSLARPQFAPTDEVQARKSVLASLVSSQIISGRPANDDIGRPVESIDNPPGWQAIGEELSQRLANCEQLINRKAFYSAREDAEAAMLYLVRVLDLMSNSYRSEPAWYAASKAMSEAEDFSTAQRLTTDSDFLRRVILSHETPVLKDADASSLAPLAAAQHYRQYAEDKLLEAAQGHPWASEVAYALGRSYQAQADVAEDDSQQNLRWRAITLYRGARGIAPNNAMATNQLGFVLLQMDRPGDAREAIVASINAVPSLAAFENLAEVSRRLNDTATGNWAIQQAQAIQSTFTTAPGLPPFVEVDPRTFAALSPYTIGPNPQTQAPPSQNYPAQPYRTATFQSPMNP